MREWNPWEWLSIHRPDLVIELRCHLPSGIAGVWKDDTIWLCRTLGQAQRRSVLTHEIYHVLRGVAATAFRQREERIVDELAARELIPLPKLIRSLRWTHDPGQIAEECWTDRHTVQVRLTTLDPLEVAQIEHELGDLWIP